MVKIEIELTDDQAYLLMWDDVRMVDRNVAIDIDFITRRAHEVLSNTVNPEVDPRIERAMTLLRDQAMKEAVASSTGETRWELRDRAKSILEWKLSARGD